MRYYHISAGLRGCYIPDNGGIIAVNTRRELREAIAYEAQGLRDAYGFGGSKRAISAVAAEAWKYTGIYDVVLPFGTRRGKYPFGLFLSRTTRADYLAQRDSD